MNLIFTKRSVGRTMLKRSLKIAQAQINQHTKGHVQTIFCDGISNSKIAAVIGSLLRSNPNQSFAMVTDMPQDKVKDFLKDVEGNDPDIKHVYADGEILN